GLSMVAVIGAERGLAADAGPFIAVVMGVITATFGGILRDILGAESPLVLRKEIYVTAALIGATLYVGASGLGMTKISAGLVGFAGCFIVRAMAITWHWSLPPYKSRPGRTVSELDKLGL
ncbi:MAG: TRIC cation channel family protein, partial [Hyphomicrobiaceae bacterium]